ncbi:Zn-dependent hydrolase [Aureimonas sp. SA4125]|uniref:allantoate amidohydrolase n=1 Tax=Aureimonas sp. SA4125 TaxID=2826993 RepID=UPI001CC4FE78|nr:allantoate amidohydrolase [Aureimonas sp. SA4125]BDA85744.1 Zn-dependent hydrolase [Aureimonas sp. SA4125]
MSAAPRAEMHGDAAAMAAEAMALIEDLAAISDEPGRLTRLYLSASHRRAADHVRAQMIEMGLATSIDAAGTVVGRYEGSRPGMPALLLGSHIDTVRDAGRFDGALGVAVALAVVANLARRNRRLPFAIEILAFGDEEGIRFPSTLAGSRAIAGSFDLSTLADRDADGISLADALRAFGSDPAAIAAAARRPQDVLGYIEVHIEQGRVLEHANQAVGLVSGISGATRLGVTVEGVSGHAGTLTMPDRRDALCGAAEMVLAIEDVARGCEQVVATVGRLVAEPGAVNVVPGKVAFTLDLRTFRDAERRRVLGEILERCDAIAGRRGLELHHEVFYDQPTTVCDRALKAGLAATLSRLGLDPIEIQSSAGHDGLALAALFPMAMLFVRCKDGVSHHPDESVSPADIGTAGVVLRHFLEALH